MSPAPAAGGGFGRCPVQKGALSALPQLLQRRAVELIDGQEAAVPERGPVVEDAGQAFGGLEGIHVNKLSGNIVPSAVLAQLPDALKDVGALVVVIDGQAGRVDGLPLASGAKRGYVPSKLSASSSYSPA